MIMKLKINVKTILKAVSLCVFALIFALLCGLRALILSDGTLASQFVRSNWQNGDIRYAQISVFLRDGTAFSYDNVRAFHATLETKLDEASIKNENENAKLYTDAYSAPGTISASTDRASANSISVTATGGDFFIFHPLKLLDGSFYSDDDINGDGVVIDDVLSWQLFGSYDVSGLLIYMDGKPFTVTGVVARQNGGDYDLSYTDKPHMYMPLDTYQRIVGETYITCYELLVPDPISNFGMKLVKDNLGISAENAVYVENSSRFDAAPLWEQLGSFMRRSMRTSLVIYPYWENIAVAAVDKCAVIFLFQCIIGAVFVILAIIYIIIFIYRHRNAPKEAAELASDKFDEIRSRIRSRRNERGKHNEEK